MGHLIYELSGNKQGLATDLMPHLVPPACDGAHSTFLLESY